MPIGVLLNVAAVAVGGIAGSLLSKKLSEELKTQMAFIFGICAMGMGISSVVLMKNMPAVILCVVVGTIIGICLKLGKGINGLTSKLLGNAIKAEDRELMLTAIVLFCASGTGIYGSLDSGMTGNHSILITKSILDLFTAMIFACRLGKATSLIALPQIVIMGSLFCLAKVIVPLTNEAMIADFKACGGFLLLATSMRMLKLRDLPVADMIPAMILVMPVSYLWVQYILPLIA